MTTQPTPRQVMVVQQLLRWLVCGRAGSSPPQRQPIHARMVGPNTVAAIGVTVSGGDPVRLLANRLVRDGYDPQLSMTIWRGEKPWRYVRSIGQPDQMKFKAKTGDS